MKIAIVYDWLDKWGGAERILATLFEAYPEADIYTLYVDYARAGWARKYRSRIRTTFLQTLYRFCPFKQLLVPLMPLAAESLDLSNYDFVLSLSSSFMKGVITRPETKHYCYLFAPTRYLWHEAPLYSTNFFLFRPLASYLRAWDYIAARRPDKIFTLSHYDQRLIKKYYQLEAEILLPPFPLDYWQSLRPEVPMKIVASKSYYLYVGRLEPYKRVDLLVQAFNKLAKETLIIIGKGSELAKLQRQAEENIRFIPELTDQELAWYYQNAKALLMPQSEDFGYTALESLFFKTPVITYQRSGTAEYITPGTTGEYLETQSVSGLLSLLAKFHTKSYNFSNFDWRKYDQKTFLAKVDRFINYQEK